MHGLNIVSLRMKLSKNLTKSMKTIGKAKLYSWSRVKANIKQVNTLTEDEDQSTGYIRVPPPCISRQEFVCSLWYWLGIPIFSSTDSVCCSCGSAVDQFGDHLLGCSHGPMRIRRHDVLCDVIFHALLQDNSGCRREQRCGSIIWIAQGIYILHPDYLYGISLLITLMLLCVIPYRISQSAALAQWCCCIVG